MDEEVEELTILHVDELKLVEFDKVVEEAESHDGVLVVEIEEFVALRIA